MKNDLAKFWDLCRSKFTEDSPSFAYLQSRGYGDFKRLAEVSDLGYYRGKCLLNFQHPNLWAFLKKWADNGNGEAVVYPLRSLSGELLGVQLGALKPGAYQTFTLPEAKSAAVFFRPNNLDLKQLYSEGKIAIVEGCLDCLSLAHFASPVVSTLRAYVSDTQVREFKRWITTLFCALDNDTVGDKAHAKLLKDVGNSFRIVRTPPSRKDTQEIFQSNPSHLERWVGAKLPKEMQRSVYKNQ